MLNGHAVAKGFGEHADLLDRALQAAERTIELDPYNQGIRVHKATAHFYRDEMELFHAEAEHALELNRNDAETLATLGYMLCRAGHYDQGAPMIKKAISLNPIPHKWYQDPAFRTLFLKGDHETAIGLAHAQETAASFWSFVYQEVENAELRNMEDAQRATEQVAAGVCIDGKGPHDAFAEIRVGDHVRLTDDHDDHAEWMVTGRSFGTMTYDLTCGDIAMPDRVLHGVHVKYLEKIDPAQLGRPTMPGKTSSKTKKKTAKVSPLRPGPGQGQGVEGVNVADIASRCGPKTRKAARS